MAQQPRKVIFMEIICSSETMVTTYALKSSDITQKITLQHGKFQGKDSEVLSLVACGLRMDESYII
jgi:hypothetical protein